LISRTRCGTLNVDLPSLFGGLPLAVTRRNYIVTPMDVRKPVNVCVADYVRDCEYSSVLSRAPTRIMWGSTDEALKFKSSMADGETIYSAPYRINRRDNKKIEYTTSTYLLIECWYMPARPFSYILTRHYFCSIYNTFPKDSF